MNYMNYIISGPSCVGKSTFLQSPQIFRLLNIPSTYPVLFPESIPNHPDAQQNGCLIHYNILRIADRYYGNPDKQIDSYYNFASDPAWNEICALSIPRQAIVLLASRTVLEKRMSSRKYVEPRKLTARSSKKYPGNHWKKVLAGIDLHEFYVAWCSELRKIGITHTLINCENRDYEVIREDQLKSFRLNT